MKNQHHVFSFLVFISCFSTLLLYLKYPVTCLLAYMTTWNQLLSLSHDSSGTHLKDINFIMHCLGLCMYLSPFCPMMEKLTLLSGFIDYSLKNLYLSWVVLCVCEMVVGV